MATVWILLAQVVCLQLISATMMNIAYRKEAHVSSYRSGHYAARAVDGNTNAVWPGGIINTAQGQATAWWKVDLLGYVQEATAKIYFRTDYKYRRNGVQLYTSTAPFSIYPSGQLCHTVSGRADGRDILDVVSVNCTGTWRYLMVYTQTDNDGQGAVLDFGELEVQVCSTGNYGQNCTKSCRSRQCAVTPTSCNRYTAKCPEGRCKTGWTGSDCTEACQKGRYGANCGRICGHCVGSCDVVDGHCPSGCVDGYCGTSCKNKLEVSSPGPDPITISVTATVIGVVLTLVVCGGTFLRFFTLCRLKWVKSDESTEMDIISNTQVTSQTLSEHPQSESRHVYNNDYAVLDVQTKSDNKEYDVIRSRD